MSKAETIANLRNQVDKILQSHHVSSVEIGYECELNNKRYYTAVSRSRGEQHRYRVRVQENSNGERFIKCSCRAAAKEMLCRNADRVAEVDSQRTGTPLYLEGIATYKAHTHYSYVKPLVCELCGKFSEDGEIHFDCYMFEELSIAKQAA